jgi:hypothetical protein
MRRGALLIAWVLVGQVGSDAVGQNPAQPGYCWLTFGPEAKLRVLVCLEGKSITMERRVGDKVEGVQERFPGLKDCKDVTIKDPDGKTSYVIKAVEDLGLVDTLGKGLAIEVEIKGATTFWEGARARLADQPARAPQVRFNAPLSIGVAETMRGTVHRTLVWKPPSDLALVKGDRPTELTVTIRNKDPEADSYVTVCTTDDSGAKCLFPEALRPVLDVEFPSAKVGGQPVRKQYTLDKFC